MAQAKEAKAGAKRPKRLSLNSNNYKLKYIIQSLIFFFIIEAFGLGIVLSADNEVLQDSPVYFLKQGADTSCMAILPQCFTKEQWAQMCTQDPSLRKTHLHACKQAIDLD